MSSNKMLYMDTINQCLSSMLLEQFMNCLLISYHWSLSIHPKYIRKPLVCCCYQGVQKETKAMKWVIKLLVSNNLIPSLWANICSQQNVKKV